MYKCTYQAKQIKRRNRILSKIINRTARRN